MKIQNSDIQQPISRVAHKHVGKADADRKAAATTESASAVSVSDTSRKLAAARAPEVPDEARIAHLRELVSKGKLPIDPGAIADAMLREEK